MELKAIDYKNKIFNTTRGTTNLEYKDRKLVKIDFKKLLPEEEQLKNFHFVPETTKNFGKFHLSLMVILTWLFADLTTVRVKQRSKDIGQYVPALHRKKWDFEVFQPNEKVPQGCTLKNFFDCRLVDVEQPVSDLLKSTRKKLPIYKLTLNKSKKHKTQTVTPRNLSRKNSLSSRFATLILFYYRLNT